MTINLRGGYTVLFTGDSVTEGDRSTTANGLGVGYPLRIAREWGRRHPRRRVTWRNRAHRGAKVTDLQARWQTDVLDARPDVVSILVGVNDAGWQTLDPKGFAISPDDFAEEYDRLLRPLAAAGARIVLIEPFLLPISGVVRAGCALVDEAVRARWRVDLDAKIAVVRELASRADAHLVAADRMFAELCATSTPEDWCADGVHPTPAGHAALAAEWLRAVE